MKYYVPSDFDLLVKGRFKELAMAEDEAHAARKTGEGSRGGKIIGHTKSGKPIYQQGFSHPSVKTFSKQDHIDAAKKHIQVGGNHHEDYVNEAELANSEERDMHPASAESHRLAYHHADQADLHEKAGGIHWSQRTKVAKSFKEQIPGGMAAGKTPKDFDKKKLKEGAKVEAEHTDSKNMAKEIAMDHLTEDKKYYKKLKTIEKK